MVADKRTCVRGAGEPPSAVQSNELALKQERGGALFVAHLRIPVRSESLWAVFDTTDNETITIDGRLARLQEGAGSLAETTGPEGESLPAASPPRPSTPETHSG